MMKWFMRVTNMKWFMLVTKMKWFMLVMMMTSKQKTAERTRVYLSLLFRLLGLHPVPIPLNRRLRGEHEVYVPCQQ